MALHTTLASYYDSWDQRTIVDVYNSLMVDEAYAADVVQVRKTVGAILSIIIPQFGRSKTEDVIHAWEVITEDRLNTLTNKLTKIRQVVDPKGRALGSVAKLYNSRNEADGKFVFVRSGLCHRDCLTNVTPLSYQLGSSKKEWILCDNPPERMTGTGKDSGEAQKVAYLELPTSVPEKDRLLTQPPFIKKLGWYPHCEFAGVVDNKTFNREHFPTLKFGAGWVRKPKAINEIIQQLLSVLQQYAKEDSKYPKLSHPQDRIALYYFIPTFYFANGIPLTEIDSGILKILLQLDKTYPNEMGACLKKLYETESRLSSAGS